MGDGMPVFYARSGTGGSYPDLHPRSRAAPAMITTDADYEIAAQEQRIGIEEDKTSAADATDEEQAKIGARADAGD
ncbi:hypothetical protein MAPG_10580 [Magnaporthiopsis poae ATCC 64411]|uniref:Uncharacterized protein n=1 Tax=Magnaporthiopsis poae (strain ATCC 64411 / 73-15) TaxID=644358 RepID=A0A0C4ECZ1_MAGP6|nr:hypothetical protein MAPG_10580 [Magnaporthiopsis poae ATCC 64411]